MLARRSRSRCHYQLVDEYNGDFSLMPATSREPLTLRRLIRLLDTVEGDIETNGAGLVLCWPDCALQWACLRCVVILASQQLAPIPH